MTAGADPDEVAPDGSPVELYLRLPGQPTAGLIDAAIPARSHVLDLGCGVGRVGAELERAGHVVTGVDNSSAMLRHAAARGIETVEAELVGLDLGRRFDVVALLSHFVNEADISVRAAFWRAATGHVRSGGLIVVERHGPGWIRDARPTTTTTHGVEIELHDLERSMEHGREVLHARVTYRMAGRSFTQSFDAIEVDDEALAAEAAAYGLVPDRVLDDHGELVLLRAD